MCPLQQLQHRRFNLGKRSCRRLAAGNDQTIPTWLNLVQMQANGFTQQSFGPVPGHRPAYVMAGRKAKTAHSLVICLKQQDSQWMPPALTSVPHSLNVTGLPQMITFLHSRQRRRCIRAKAAACRQKLAARSFDVTVTNGARGVPIDVLNVLVHAHR